MGEKGEGFTGTTIKDTWTITRGGRWKQGREVGKAGVWGRVGGKGRKLYLKHNKNQKYLKNKIKNVYLNYFQMYGQVYFANITLYV